MDKVSVVIPTYNRFKYLLNTIKSIQEQTHKNIEINCGELCWSCYLLYNIVCQVNSGIWGISLGKTNRSTICNFHSHAVIRPCQQQVLVILKCIVIPQ